MRKAAAVLLCLSAGAAAAGPRVPVRWQGGPLEVLRRPVDPAAQEALRNWYRPATLDLLNGTPVNCLLVTWAAGLDAATEREQRRQVAAYAAAARRRNIAVLGLVYPGADPARAAAEAAEAQLDGTVAEDSRGVAPRVRALSEADSAAATPTTEPWIDSNIWLVRSLRARGQPAWLGYPLEHASPGDYLRAIADAAVAGGRWAVGLDDAFAAGLWRREPEALARWGRIAEGLRFFEEQAEWRGFADRGPLGIVADPAPGDLAAECQNLVTRRRIPYRLLCREDLFRLSGFDAVLAMDVAAPAAQERDALAAFAKRGGVAVVDAAWGWPAPASPGYQEHALGKGRVVVYRDPDPETVAKDMLDLLGRDNLPVRLFNVSSVLSHVSEDRATGRLLVQLVNYASEPSGAVTVRVAGSYAAARLYSPGGEPVTLEVDGGEVRIPQIRVYAAVMFEHAKEKQ